MPSTKSIQEKRPIQSILLTFQLLVPIETTTNSNLFFGNKSISTLRVVQGSSAVTKFGDRLVDDKKN